MFLRNMQVVTQDLDIESGNEAVQRELRLKAPQRPGAVLMTSPGLLWTKSPKA